MQIFHFHSTRAKHPHPTFCKVLRLCIPRIISAVMEEAANRRVGVLAQHLIATGGSFRQAIGVGCEACHAERCSECVNLDNPAITAQPTSSSYASATGRENSYSRIHGEVSRAPAIWRRIESVQREDLEDVKYEKALGEGRAKVRRCRCGGRGGLR